MHFRTEKAYIRGLAGGAFRGRPTEYKCNKSYSLSVLSHVEGREKIVIRMSKIGGGGGHSEQCNFKCTVVYYAGGRVMLLRGLLALFDI